MPIGTQQSALQLNALLASYVAQMNTLTANIVQLQAYAVAEGVSGLQALPNPFTAADAATFIQAVSYLNTVAGVYTGAVQQGGTGGTGASLFNFQNQMAQLLGPTPPPA